MGTDIHVHIEYRINGKWEHYGAPEVDRWYELFSVMAGVRGTQTPIVEPRGFPEDASLFTAWDWEGGDGHNASYLQDQEIVTLEEWLEERHKYLESVLNTYIGGCGLIDFLRYDDKDFVPPGTDSIRLVFWFDS